MIRFDNLTISDDDARIGRKLIEDGVAFCAVKAMGCHHVMTEFFGCLVDSAEL